VRKATQKKAARIMEKVLSEDELRALLAQETATSATGLRNKALLVLMATSGLRVSEALGLRPADLEREKGEVVAVKLPETKAGVTQKAGVNPEAAALIDRWLERRKALGINGRSPVFCTVTEGAATGFATGGEVRPGQPLSRQYIYKLVKSLAERAGIEGKRVSPHSLRHTFGTLLARTKPGAVVQKALRHATPDVTNLYVHIGMGDVREAVNGLPVLTDEVAEEGPAPDAEAKALAARIAALTPEQREALKALLG
jgi:site-specific recombinase XerD